MPLKSHSADGKKQERILTDAEIQNLKGEVDECVVNSKESKKKGSKPNGAKGDHPDVEMALPEPKVPRRGAAARAAAQALSASLATPAPSQAPKAKPGRKGKGQGEGQEEPKESSCQDEEGWFLLCLYDIMSLNVCMMQFYQPEPVLFSCSTMVMNKNMF